MGLLPVREQLPDGNDGCDQLVGYVLVIGVIVLAAWAAVWFGGLWLIGS